jgi:hypothetical protein
MYFELSTCSRFQAKPAPLLVFAGFSFFSGVVEEVYGTRYLSSSFCLINVGSGFSCLRKFFLVWWDSFTVLGTQVSSSPLSHVRSVFFHWPAWFSITAQVVLFSYAGCAGLHDLPCSRFGMPNGIYVRLTGNGNWSRTCNLHCNLSCRIGDKTLHRVICLDFWFPCSIYM